MNTHLPSKVALLAATVAMLFAAPLLSQADVIVVSDTQATNEIGDFLTANFSNVTEVRHANYADFAATTTQDAVFGTGAFAGAGAADFVIIGRALGSGAYSAGAADGYNGLAIPVISFSSYTSRETGNRMGWHDGGAANDKSTVGDETEITAAGNAMFGTGPVNWHESNGDTFNGTGTASTVGGGQILATLGGDVLVARWNAGDAPGDPTAAGVGTFGGDRLLFNLDDDDLGGGDRTTFASLTVDGQAALVTSMVDIGFTTTAVPEPSSLLVLSAFGLAGLVRRRK